MVSFTPLSCATQLLPFLMDSQIDINTSKPPHLYLDELASATLTNNAQYEND
jgi:hypothetical protein